MESEQELWARARQRAEDKMGFYIHLGFFILVNAALIGIWWFTGGGFFWPAFVLGFWGIGLAAHAIGTFGSGRYTDRLVQREYERLRDRK
ncbi:2TM domain-containing protein [Methanomassiliicoccus luminyensis]|jgi:hypothetical protein|uniref:2TM domain-containing protein n=1 Tax=Methanomassiliicoccus luminyensis TaxID=1080712 RepID=UPI000360B5EC|nr:2TM domain-containing protein [Methanomassiliicoccus luminyensis]